MSETKELGRASTYEGRMSIIGETVCKQLSIMYVAHSHLKTAEASGFFLREAAEAVNRVMPTHLNDAQFMEAMRDVWRELTALHKSKFWPSIHEIGKAAAKVGARLKRSEDRMSRAFNGSFEAEQRAREEEKKPDTIEGWLKRLNETDEMIRSGELKRPMGLLLRRIPCAALARLGYEGDTSLEGLQPTPQEHLPETAAEPAPVAKPLMAMSSEELNTRLIVDGATPPKPIDNSEFDAVLADGGDALPDWGAL